MSHSKVTKRTSRSCPKRSERAAAMLCLMLVFAMALLIFVATSCASVVKFFTAHRHAECAIEAASLAAARELSQVVVEDPNYGLVGLSDGAPTATSSIAADGKPIPVIGINTLVSTARTSMLVAKHLNNEEYLRLARLDAANTAAAGRRLVDGLKLALREDASAPLSLHGKAVKPLTAARQAFVKSLALARTMEAVELKKFDLELGYLSQGGTTNTALTVTEQLAEVPAASIQNGCYKAFKDLAISGQSFIFAAVGAQPSLVAKDQFVSDQGKCEMPSSIVRAKAELEFADSRDRFFGNVLCSACAAPFSLTDRAAAGVMIVGLPDGYPSGYLSLADYINDPRSSRTNMEMFRAHGGDYPLDAQAQLSRDFDNGQTRTLSNVFVQGLYDWIRTAHGRVKIDSLLAVIGDRMQPSIGSMAYGQSLVYRFDKNGAVIVDGYFVSDVPNQIVHDRQVYTLGLNSLKANNAMWTIAFRDQVHNLGVANGGKHCGQLMEMDGCLRPTGSLYGKVIDSKHGDLERKSYFDGGLAVEFVISSPQYN
ncbi:MAG: hypothetical protein WC714_04915 [Candidatus Obscuribacterales bacterium]